MTKTRAVLATLAISGCGDFSNRIPEPNAPLSAFTYIKSPQVEEDGGTFYLRYEFRLACHRPYLGISFYRTPKKVLYYFWGARSGTHPCGEMSRSLMDDDNVEYARNDAVYWIDPDGHETHLKVIKKP